MHIGVRAFFASGGGGGGGGEAVNHLAKKFSQVAHILTKQPKETRVIPCTNNGQHMK